MLRHRISLGRSWVWSLIRCARYYVPCSSTSSKYSYHICCFLLCFLSYPPNLPLLPVLSNIITHCLYGQISGLEETNSPCGKIKYVEMMNSGFTAVIQFSYPLLNVLYIIHCENNIYKYKISECFLK